jgi:hypothetical protein
VGVRWRFKPSSSPNVNLVARHTWLNLTRTLVKGTCKLFSLVAFKCSKCPLWLSLCTFFWWFFVFWLIVVRDNNLGSRYGALGLALDINMVFEVMHDSKPKKCFMRSPSKTSDCYCAFMDGCFGCIMHLYKSASFNYRLNVTQKKFPMTLIPWMGSRKGKGWGIYICKHAHQQTKLIIVSIKATILNTIKDEQIIYPTFNVHPMTK